MLIVIFNGIAITDGSISHFITQYCFQADCFHNLSVTFSPGFGPYLLHFQFTISMIDCIF